MEWLNADAFIAFKLSSPRKDAICNAVYSQSNRQFASRSRTFTFTRTDSSILFRARWSGAPRFRKTLDQKRSQLPRIPCPFTIEPFHYIYSSIATSRSRKNKFSCLALGTWGRVLAPRRPTMHWSSQCFPRMFRVLAQSHKQGCQSFLNISFRLSGKTVVIDRETLVFRFEVFLWAAIRTRLSNSDPNEFSHPN